MREGPDSIPAPAEERTPNKVLAGIAATLPVASVLVGCLCAFPLAGGGDANDMVYVFQAGGYAMYAILALVLFVPIICAVLVLLAALGKRVPVSVPIFLACLPWLAGLAGARYGMYQVEQALHFVDAESLNALLAKGTAESMVSRAFGASLSGALLVAIGVGLALGSLAVRAPDRSALGAVVGGVMTLPVLGASLVIFSGAGVATSVAVLAALGVVLAAALGGAGVGRDAPSHRSGANAVGGAVAAGLGFAAAISAVTLSALITVFDALAVVDASSLGEILLRAVDEMSTLTTVDSLAPLLAIIAATGVLGWAVARGGVSPGRIAGGIVVFVIVALVTGLDAMIGASAASTIASAGPPAWEDEAGFVPLDVNDVGESTTRPHALVTVDELVAHDGERFGADVLTPAGRPALSTTFTRLIRGPEPFWRARAPRYFGQEPTPEWLLEEEDLQRRPNLVIAFDARTTVDTLRAVLDAANDAGAHSIWFLGTERSGLSTEQVERIRDGAPYFAFRLDRDIWAPALLEGAEVPDPSADALLLHGVIDANVTTTIRSRPGGEAVEFRSDEHDPMAVRLGEAGHPDQIVYLSVSEAATLASVVSVVTDLDQRRYRPLLVTGELPGDPEQPLATLEDVLAEVEGIGLAGTPLGTGRRPRDGSARLARPSGAPARVRLGRPDVRGDLSTEIVRRVVRRHTNELRFCYESRLADAPNARGDVTVSFIISPTGAVQSAAVASSTAQDARLESCLVSAFRRWTFPAPEGGGVAGANQPMTFSSGGD